MNKPMTYRLVILQGPSSGGSFDLIGDVISIGRDVANDIALDDGKVSRFHVRLTREGAGFTLEDLDSANGTTVNGQRITNLCPLSPGDRITLGTESVLEYDAVVEGQIVPPVAPSRPALPLLLVLGGGAVVVVFVVCLVIGALAWYNGALPFSPASPRPIVSPTKTLPAHEASPTVGVTPTLLPPTAAPTDTDTPTAAPTDTPLPPTPTPTATRAFVPSNTPRPPQSGGPLTYLRVDFVSASKITGTANDAYAKLSLVFSGGAAPYQVIDNDANVTVIPQITGKFTADGKEYLYINFTQRTSCGATLTASVTLISADGQRFKNSYFIPSIVCP